MLCFFSSHAYRFTLIVLDCCLYHRVFFCDRAVLQSVSLSSSCKLSVRILDAERLPTKDSISLTMALLSLRQLTLSSCNSEYTRDKIYFTTLAIMETQKPDEYHLPWHGFEQLTVAHLRDTVDRYLSFCIFLAALACSFLLPLLGRR